MRDKVAPRGHCLVRRAVMGDRASRLPRKLLRVAVGAPDRVRGGAPARSWWSRVVCGVPARRVACGAPARSGAGRVGSSARASARSGRGGSSAARPRGAGEAGRLRRVRAERARRVVCGASAQSGRVGSCGASARSGRVGSSAADPRGAGRVGSSAVPLRVAGLVGSGRVVGGGGPARSGASWVLYGAERGKPGRVGSSAALPRRVGSSAALPRQSGRVGPGSVPMRAGQIPAT